MIFELVKTLTRPDGVTHRPNGREYGKDYTPESANNAGRMDAKTISLCEHVPVTGYSENK